MKQQEKERCNKPDAEQKDKAARTIIFGGAPRMDIKSKGRQDFSKEEAAGAEGKNDERQRNSSV